MSLKEKLGEELFKQVSEKLGKDEKLILNDGTYIPKDKFDEANNKAKQLGEQVAERDTQIEQLKNDTQTNDELKSKIEELQQQNEKTKSELSQQLESQKLDSGIDKKLMQKKAKNIKAVKALLDMGKIKLTDDGITGFEEQLEEIIESDGFLFEQEEEEEEKNERTSSGFDGGNKGKGNNESRLEKMRKIRDRF